MRWLYRQLFISLLLIITLQSEVEARSPYRYRSYGRAPIAWYGYQYGWPSYYANYIYPTYGSYTYHSTYTSWSYPSYPYNGRYYLNDNPISAREYAALHNNAPRKRVVVLPPRPRPIKGTTEVFFGE